MSVIWQEEHRRLQFQALRYHVQEQAPEVWMPEGPLKVAGDEELKLFGEFAYMLALGAYVEMNRRGIRHSAFDIAGGEDGQDQ